MAYLNFLASIPVEQVESLRRNSQLVLTPSFQSAISHLIGYWVEVQPLGKFLGEAIDGGHELSEQLWHPLRTPKFHSPEEAKVIYEKIVKEWEFAESAMHVREDDWFRLEIERVLRVFEFAVNAGESVVSILAPPADQERASRVRIPLCNSN